MPSRTKPDHQAGQSRRRPQQEGRRSFVAEGAQGAEGQRGERHHGGRGPGLGGQRTDLPIDLGPLPQGGRHAVHGPRRRAPRRHGHGQGADHEPDAGTGAALRPAVEGDAEGQAPVDVDQDGGEIVGRHRARGRASRNAIGMAAPDRRPRATASSSAGSSRSTRASRRPPAASRVPADAPTTTRTASRASTGPPPTRPSPPAVAAASAAPWATTAGGQSTSAADNRGASHRSTGAGDQIARSPRAGTASRRRARRRAIGRRHHHRSGT